MPSTSAKTWLLFHRILFALAFFALLSIPVALSSFSLRSSGPQWPWFVLGIDVFIIGGLYLFQYLHQAYRAMVHYAKFPIGLFLSNTFVLALYLLAASGLSFDFVGTAHLWGLFLFHGFTLVGYFVYHNKTNITEGNQNDVTILDDEF